MKAWKLRSYTHPSFDYLFCHAQSFVNQKKWGRRPKNGEAKKFLARSARKSLLLPVLNFSHIEALYIFTYDVMIKMFLVWLFFGVFVACTII